MLYIPSAVIFSQSSDNHSSYPSNPTSLVSIIEGSNSEEVVIHRRGEQIVEDSSACSTIAPCTEWLLRLSGIGQLHQQVAIGTLPDEVLLKIFKFFVSEIFSYYCRRERWPKLVHVCRRWRNLAFTFPRHLNLQLVCKSPKRSVKRMLDIWPEELPVYILEFDLPLKGAVDNVVAALKLNHRISVIRFDRTTRWETFAPLMEHSFPVLTHLWVRPRLSIADPISRSFLGGSAPCLRDLVLIGIPFPALPELLLSATNLVRLLYNNIPRSGYIPPQAMATGLSALTHLESLSLIFQPPPDLPDRVIRNPRPHTRTLLPTLTNLHFRGVPEYMEDLVSQIDAPLLEGIEITFFDQEVLEVSQLAKFVRRADSLSLIDQAEVTFNASSVSVRLSPEFHGINPKTLTLRLECSEEDLRLSHLVQFCASCLPTLSPFECLRIVAQPQSGYTRYTWRDVVDNPDPQWLELLRLFNTVKDLGLTKIVALRAAQVLRRLPAEQVSEVLPALDIVFRLGPEPFGPVWEAISEFADMRQLSGHPVSISDWERTMQEN